MNKYFIINESRLESRARQAQLSKEDIMYFNINRLKGKIFMGYAISFILESYYKLFLDYNGKKKD